MATLLVNIDVDDLERAVAFYTAAFELTIGRRLGSAIVELLGAQVPIYLLESATGTTPFADATSTRDYRRHWTPVHLDFVVKDLGAALRRAEGAGARREGAIREAAWGRIVQLSDEFGHGVCLLEFRGGGYDEIRTV